MNRRQLVQLLLAVQVLGRLTPAQGRTTVKALPEDWVNIVQAEVVPPLPTVRLLRGFMAQGNAMESAAATIMVFVGDRKLFEYAINAHGGTLYVALSYNQVIVVLPKEEVYICCDHPDVTWHIDLVDL